MGEVTSMVERVAKALHEKPGKGYGWNDTSEAERSHAREYARAAIEAMREPTDAMVEAGGDYVDKERVILVEGIYQDMIDAALNEQVSG